MQRPPGGNDRRTQSMRTVRTGIRRSIGDRHPEPGSVLVEPDIRGRENRNGSVGRHTRHDTVELGGNERNRHVLNENQRQFRRHDDIIRGERNIHVEQQHRPQIVDPEDLARRSDQTDPLHRHRDTSQSRDLPDDEVHESSSDDDRQTSANLSGRGSRNENDQPVYNGNYRAPIPAHLRGAGPEFHAPTRTQSLVAGTLGIPTSTSTRQI